MNYKAALYTILEDPKICPLDANGTVDLIKLRKLLVKMCPGKYHLEWTIGGPLNMFDMVDPDTIKLVFHSDDEHTEWMLKYG